MGDRDQEVGRPERVGRPQAYRFKWQLCSSSGPGLALSGFFLLLTSLFTLPFPALRLLPSPLSFLLLSSPWEEKPEEVEVTSCP